MEMTESYRSFYQRGEDATKAVCTDEFGFITTSREASLRNERALKTEWYEVIDCYERDRKKFKDAIQKKGLLQRGIPLSLKSRIWRYLLIPIHRDALQRFSTLDQFIQHSEESRHKHIYSSESGKKYQSLISQESSYDYQIHVDVQRTFRHHFLFYNKFGRGQCELFNLLVAFANRFRRVGYCQGLSDIGAILLMYFQEHEAFEMMESLIKKNNLEGLFDQNLTRIPSLMKAQSSLFTIVIPDISTHLEKNTENFSFGLIGWYITLFARFDIKLTLRVWDYLIFYGFNVLMYFAAAILKYHEKSILGSSDESLIQLLGKLDEKEMDENMIVDIAVRFLKEAKYKDIK